MFSYNTLYVYPKNALGNQSTESAGHTGNRPSESQSMVPVHYLIKAMMEPGQKYAEHSMASKNIPLKK